MPATTNNAQETQRSIPYEILRRSDGKVALSSTKGLMGFAPKKVRILGDDTLEWCNAEHDRCVQMLKVPRDVLMSMAVNRSVRLYEFAPTGQPLGHVVAMGTW